MVAVESDDDDGYMWLHEDEVTDEHTTYEGTTADVSYEVSPNGWWSVYEDGEQVARDRGEEKLKEALDELGSSLDDATELD